MGLRLERLDKKSLIITEKNIALALMGSRDFKSRYEFYLPNCYTRHDNECDVFAIRRSGICDEFEIKISRSDFFSDQKKEVMSPNPKFIPQEERTDRHREDESKVDYFSREVEIPWYSEKVRAPKSQALAKGEMVNYFWYLTPEGLINHSEIPDFAGLMEVRSNGAIRTVKSAPKLHSKKMSAEEKYRIARKACFRLYGSCEPEFN